MDIKELEDYRLSDAVKFHTHLNPRIWGTDEHLLPEVREKLLAIAADFKEFLGLDLEVTDITVSGSNAAYTYTDHSDIDLHLVTDLPKADASDVYRELFDAKKYQYNDQHNFKIGGYDVELYVQNANENPKSQGIYSVQDNEWISVPKRRRPDIDDISVKSKYEDLGHRIEAAVKSGDAAQLEMLGKKVREFRQAGLDKTGEFGPENLAFKVLRSNGTLDQLRTARLAARDQELSIAEAGKKKKKKSFRYGFGGYYSPGYNYYGQTDAAADGGGDGGGGENVQESTESQQDIIERFTRSCADLLGIKTVPKIKLRRDPQWTKINGTFGRYTADPDHRIELATHGRHIVDILRTLAHEMTHARQNEVKALPDNAGETGSEYEDSANAMAGRIMRHWAESEPHMFQGVVLEEGSLNEAASDEAWELVGQPAPEIQQFVKQMGYGNDEQSVATITAIIDRATSTQIPAASIPKLKNLANKGTDVQTLKAVQQISGRSDAEQQYTKLMKARDAAEGRNRDISGYLQYVKSGNYDPPVLLKLPTGIYVVGGRTRLYAALALGVPANVKIISADSFKQVAGEALVHRGYTQGTDPNDIWNVRDDNSRRLRHRRNEVVLAQAAPKIEQRVKVAYQPTTTDGSGQRYRPEAGSHYAYIQGRMTRGLPQGLETGRPLKFDGRKFMYADSGEIFAGADYVHFTSDRRVIAYNSEKPIPVAGPEVSVGVTEGMAESVQQVVAEVIKMPPTINSSQGMADWAYQDAQDKKASSKGSLQGIPSEVYDMGDHLRVFVLDEQGPVLYLALEKFLDGFKSGAVAVEPRGRGKNLAVQVYQAVSDTFGLPIYSDTTQTDASRIGIWQKLMTSLPGRVVGYDQRTQEDLPLTATDQGPAVRSNQPVYTQRTAKDLSKPVTGQNRSRTRLLKLLPSQQVVAEASGYIPVNKKEARDPRYSMAITQDIRPGENQRQAAKMGWKTNPAGTPPTARTNGLIEELTRKLQLVKEGVGFPLISEEELEEVAMSPSALRAFAASPAAAGMQAGFEAELVFAGALEGSDESGEMEPDYDMDERASDIDSIMNFFTSGDMSGIDSDPRSNSYRRARSSLEEDYFDWYNDQVGEAFEEDPETVIENWIVENDWDQDRQIEEFLREELGLSSDEVAEVTAAMERRVDGKGTAADADLVYKYVEAEAGVREQLELRVSDAIQENNSDYESALDEFRENYIEEADESVWLIARGYRLMSDVGNTFDFEWPYWTSGFGDNEEGGYNPDVARRLASSLSDTLGVKTTVSSGYHSAKRDTTTWIFEPDGSLDADDSDAMPVEIVSPPMPLSKTLEILPRFFEWAAENGAYANDSTGFHMSVSMPDHAGDLLDYTKLAVFLGDEYVLQQFGREANTYAKSALQKIREKKGNVKAEEVLSTMRRHLGHFASRALAQPSGFGKYTSINPKTNYIEFRSAGGSNYFEDMDKIQNTLMRYARAMDIAFDPDADKPEYAKKLYKMLTDTKTQQTVDPKTGTRRTEVVSGVDTDAISIFSRYVAGQLPKSELKGFLKKLQYGREVAKNPSKEKIQWQVYHPNGSSQIAVMATSAEEAIKLAKQEYRDTMNPDDAYRAVPVLITSNEVPATQTPQTDQLNAPVADDPEGNFVLRSRQGNQGVGPVLFRFSASTNSEAIQAARQWATARGLERAFVYLDQVTNLSPEELAARPVRATLGEPRPAFTDPTSSRTPVQDIGMDIAQNFQEPPASWDSGSPIVSEPQNFPAAVRR